MKIHNLPLHRSESGQALIELVFIVIICLILGIGFYEVGALVHNVSVMNKALSSASDYVAHGAPLNRVKDAVYRASNNFLGGAFLEQSINEQAGLVVEIWNPETNSKIGTFTGSGHSYRDDCSNSFPPFEDNVTPYLFWANGYQVRLGVEFNIGVYIPYIYHLTISPTLTSSKQIIVSNDSDWDGMADSEEAAYVDWAMEQKATALGVSDTEWVHPVHYDESGVLDKNNNDLDDDGDTNTVDTQVFDRDNDGVADKYDKAKNTGENKLTMNPLVGPGIRPTANNNKWAGGSCP